MTENAVVRKHHTTRTGQAVCQCLATDIGTVVTRAQHLLSDLTDCNKYLLDSRVGLQLIPRKEIFALRSYVWHYIGLMLRLSINGISWRDCWAQETRGRVGHTLEMFVNIVTEYCRLK